MMKKRCLVCMLSVLFLLAFTGISSANLFLNGDFDDFVPSNDTGGSWTSINIDGAGGWRSADGNPGGNFILNSNGSVLTDPTIEQTVFGMTSGAVYQLDVDVARIYGGYGGTALSFQIYMDDNWLMSAYTTDESVYTSLSTLFTASATSAVFSFRAETLDDSSYRIDNVSLNRLVDDDKYDPVPEPATILLFGIGILGFAGVSRRKS